MHLRDVQIPPENLKIPIFQGHGTADPVIPVFIGSSTHDVLEGLGEFEVHRTACGGCLSCVCDNGTQDSSTTSRALVWALFWVARAVAELSEGAGQ